MFKRIFIVLIFLIFAFISCQNKSDDKEPQKTQKQKTEPIVNEDSLLNAEMMKIHDKYPLINYQQVYIENRIKLNEIKKEFKYDKNSPLKNKIFITLNRKEMRYMRVGDTLVVPDTIVDDIWAYSVFPQYYHGARNLSKLIVVSNKYQCYAAYENGVQIRFAAANTGKEKTQTYPGRYALTWKDRLRKSSLDSTWVLPYTWNFHRYAGSAFHQFDMPGYAASHSCIRQFMSDAKWLFEWGRSAKLDSNGKQKWLSGTPVIIIDAFDFSRPKTGPWVALRNNKDIILELPAKPMEVEEALIPISQIPEATRNWLPDKERYKYAEDSLKARGVIREGVRITPSINFNKLRREKAARKAKEKKRLEQQADSAKTNIRIIKENLQKLDNNTIDLREDIELKKPIEMIPDTTGKR